MLRGALFGLAVFCIATPALADPFDAVLAAHPDFSGAVLVVKGGDIVFDKAYGLADTGRGIANRPSTSFHIGSASMIFTDLAALHLVHDRKLNLDNTAGQFLPDLAAPARDLRIRDLVGDGDPAHHILLARIAAAATARPFADGAGAVVVASVWAAGTGWDDGSLGADSRYAIGYDAAGRPVTPDWAAILGADGLYTTTRDMLRFIEWDTFGAIPAPHGSPETGLTRAGAAGVPNGQAEPGRMFEMSGEGGGFSAAFARQPDSTVIVIVLSNHAGPLARTVEWDLRRLAISGEH